MKYMLLIYMEENAMTDAERQACYVESTQLTHDLQAKDQYIAASPLQPVATAASVKMKNGKPAVTDGPFAETREQLGGYFLIDAKNLDDAIAIAARIPAAKKGTVEIRPIFELEGLPPMRSGRPSAISNPHITQTPKQLTAIIRLTIAKHEIREVMGPGIGELMGTLAAQKIAPTGPWFTHHFRIVPDSWDFEICVPVGVKVTPAGRVKPGEWPAMKAAKTVYQGPYEGLGDAWGQFTDWIKANGHTPADDLYESYVAGPESGTDATKWKTELIKPLKQDFPKSSP